MSHENKALLSIESWLGNKDPHNFPLYRCLDVWQGSGILVIILIRNGYHNPYITG